MINAETARKIQNEVQAERDAYVKSKIIRDVEVVCRTIAARARADKSECVVDASGMFSPKGVAEYLKNNLGYDVAFPTCGHLMTIKW